MNEMRIFSVLLLTLFLNLNLKLSKYDFTAMYKCVELFLESFII